MIRHVENPRLPSVIIAAHEIVLGLFRHVRGGHGNIFIPGNIHALAIILLIIDPGSDGETGHIPLPVIHHRMNVGGKDGLGIVVHRHRRVGPPEKCLGKGRPIIQLPRNLDISLSGIESDFCDTFRAVHLIHVMAEHGTAPVLLFLYLIIYGQKGGGPMVLGPVELNAPGNPWSREPHQSRFNDSIIIYKVITVGLVIGPLDPPAQLGQYHDLQVFVFQIYRRVILIRLFVADTLHRGIGIYLSAAPLIPPLVQKNGSLLGLPDPVCRNHRLLNPNLCLTHSRLLIP